MRAAVAASASAGLDTHVRQPVPRDPDHRDPGDPINHICECINNKPFHLIKVVADTVVPNSTTDLLIRAGNLTQARRRARLRWRPGKGVYVSFIQGSHGSLFDPSASAAATAEMQRQSVKFAASADAARAVRS